MGLLAGGAGALLFALDRSVEASGADAHAPHNDWAHNGLIKSYDHARWGIAVYYAICCINRSTLDVILTLSPYLLFLAFVAATRSTSKCARPATR